MCPDTATYVDPNDPVFDEIQDPFKKFRHSKALMLLCDNGLAKRADAWQNCGKELEATCRGHGVRKRKIIACFDKNCPYCGLKRVELAIKRNARKLEAIRRLPGHAVLCTVSYESPFALSDIENQKVWKEVTSSVFATRWKRYCDSRPDCHLDTTAMAGFEQRDGKEYLICYALGHFHDAEHKHKFREIWPDAHDAWIDRGGSHLFQSFFARALEPTKDSGYGERRAYHVILFHGGRNLRISHMDSDLFPAEELPETGNNSAPDADEQALEQTGKPLKWPRVPFICDICGQECVTTLENPHEPERVPPDKMRLAPSD